MIGVAEDDLGFNSIDQIITQDAFNGSSRADRHKNRRLDIAVGGAKRAQSGFRRSAGLMNLEAHFKVG